jgi:hypothetical protein
MKWLIQKYRAARHIESNNELASLTGIPLRTLQRRIKEPGTLLLYELRQLDEILHFTNEDKLRILTGNFDD